jgi:hypothetical protein
MQDLTKDILNHEVIHERRSSSKNENADLRHAGMDWRHPDSQDAPETSMSAWIPALQLE